MKKPTIVLNNGRKFSVKLSDAGHEVIYSEDGLGMTSAELNEYTVSLKAFEEEERLMQEIINNIEDI